MHPISTNKDNVPKTPPKTAANEDWL